MTNATKIVADSQVSMSHLQQSTVSGVFWTLSHSLIAIPVGFVANAIIARQLGPGGYGSLAVTLLAVSLASTLSNLAVGDGTIQWGASAHAQGRARDVEDLLQKSLGYHLLVQLPAMTIVALYVGRHEEAWVRFLVVIGFAIPMAFGSSALRISIENRTAASARQAMVTNLITQTSTAATACMMPSAAAVWVARTVTSSILTPLNLRVLPSGSRAAVLRPRLPRNMPDGFWRYCVFAAAGGTIGVLVSSRSETLFLQRLSTPEATGLFALAFGVAAQMRGPIDALLAPLLPSLTGVLSTHPERAPEALLRALRVNSVLAGAALLPVTPIAASLPWLYGPAYSALPLLLPPLAAAAISQALVNPLLALAQARRQSRQLLLINIAALFIDAAVALVAVPWLGAWGAVLAASVSQASAACFLATLAIRGGLLSRTDSLSVATPFLVTCGVMLVATLSSSFADTAEVRRSLLALASVAVTFAWFAILRSRAGRNAAQDVRGIPPLLPGRFRAPSARILDMLLPAPNTSAAGASGSEGADATPSPIHRASAPPNS